MVDYLIEKKINVNVAEKISGLTPLHLAILKGDTRNVSQLLKAGADVNAVTLPSKTQSEIGNRSPLTLAMKHQHLDIGKLLINAKPKPKRLSYALYTATAMGKVEWVKLLLDHGVNPNATDMTFNPLKTALARKSFQIADLLLSKGAVLTEKHIPFAPFKLRTQWMRNNRYPTFAKRSGITLVLPENPWDIEFIQPDAQMTTSDIATALYHTLIPRTLKDPSGDQFGSHILIQLREMDRMTCTLIRQGKRQTYDFHMDDLPTLQAGDILEWTTFKITDQKAADHYNRSHHYRQSGSLMQLKSTALGPQIRRHIRVPIQVTINGKKSNFILHGGLAVYDPRTNLVPLDSLASVLTMVGVHPFNGPAEIKVLRDGWKPLHFSESDTEFKAFQLKPNDHMIVTIPTEPRFPTLNPITVIVPGIHYHSYVESCPESPPTILQVITALNQGKNLTKENIVSLKADPEWIAELTHPEKLAPYLIRKHQFRAQLYNIDLAHITIRRFIKGAQKSFKKTSISLDLETIIRDWDGTEASAKKHDFLLQQGDIIELKLNKGSWTGYTAKQKEIHGDRKDGEIFC